MNQKLAKIRDEVVQDAAKYGKSIEEAAAAKLLELHLNANHVIFVAAIVCFVLGIVIGMKL